MDPTRSNFSARGAALLLAFILLGALSVVGAAAVALASRERINAYAYANADYAIWCANAAQARLWAEMSQSGMTYLGSATPVLSFTLPGGARIESPAHYDSRKPDGTMPMVKDVIFTVESAAAGEAATTDSTNKLVRLGRGTSVTTGFAHCTFVVGNREIGMEVELGYRFAF